MTSEGSSEGRLTQQEAPIQRAVPPGDDNALVALARALALPEGIIQMVQASGCETPADWRFAVLVKPQDEHEALLWSAVQSAGALDVGAMVVIANRARAAQRQLRTIKTAGCVKTLQRAKPRRPFRGTKLVTQRKEIDDSKRQQAAHDLMQLAWSWAPEAGPAKGAWTA